MIFFFLFSYTIHDLVLGISSGYDLILTRTLDQASTWIPSLPRIYIYSDKLPSNTTNIFQKEAPHANITFMELGDQDEHLVGTQWIAKWYHAQPRFLYGLYKMYIENPGYSWYGLLDDDTYLFQKNIVRRLHKYDHNNRVVVSFFWCSWDILLEYMEPQRECHPFGQGGACVIYSAELMKHFAKIILKCNEIYNDAQHAAAMRTAICMERHFGYENWTKGGYIQPWRSGFHSDPHYIHVEQDYMWDAPGSFHRLKKQDMVELSQTHLCYLQDGFFDFAHFAFAVTTVELTRRTKWRFLFGYSFSRMVTNLEEIKAISSLQTVDNGKTFFQKYDKNISIQIQCNDDDSYEEIFVDRVVRSPSPEVYLIMKCPPKQNYSI